MQCTSLKNTVINETSFIKSDLRWCNFTEAILQRSDFRGADLRNTNMENARVIDCNFEGATYNFHTVLPFSYEKAEKLGMILMEEI